MTTHFYDHQKKDIATAAVALLAACRWDLGVARVALESQAPIAALPALDQNGHPVTVGALPETFNVMLTAVGRDKIAVIKAIRGITGLGLREAKDLVEAAPKLVKGGIAEAAAEEMMKILRANGATVTVEMVTP